ncbi:MAG: 5'-methylthioadenosine/adenosylhomocysteine nucleosidase [Clostridia bacterium]|nr:5'-methylthioadenosine/adenosylhomocysteine nucleosidase [Clostridia bacterium]
MKELYKNIGIIGAMEIEIKTIRSKMENKQSSVAGGMEFVSGTLNGTPVVTAVCGIGKVCAAMCAQAMILKYNPSLIINTGVGGTLTDELSVCDIAVADSVCQHDFDLSPVGEVPGMVPAVNTVKIPCDERAVEILTACAKEFEGVRVKTGTIASGDQFIASDETRRRITGTFGAISCEMEGASIGQVCRLNNIPFAIVRAISDSADGKAEMTYTEFLPLAADNAAKMIEYIVTKY